MNVKLYDTVVDENDLKLRLKYWNMAFGLQEIDGLKVTNFLKDITKKHIENKITLEELKKEVNDKYYDIANSDLNKEADLVAINIYDILIDKSFRFDYLTYVNYHKRLFNNLDVDKFHPGEFRKQNITKKEDILNGDSVLYQNYELIESSLEQDFIDEEEVNYINKNMEEVAISLARFTSKIWQNHPFMEGNTRTTILFLQKYLTNMGFIFNFELFKEHSLYFRNALVRYNYMDYEKGISVNRDYLINFYLKLLFDKDVSLDPKKLYV